MRLLTPLDDEFAGDSASSKDKSCYFNSLRDSELAEQQQDDQHHQNDAAKAHSGVAHAVAVAAEPATKAAQQEDDQDNNEYQAKRHGVSPAKGRRMEIRRPSPQRKAYPGHWF